MFIGNQPSFQTTIIEDASHSATRSASSPDGDEDMANDSNQGIRVRVITLPKFSETGELVLVDAESLEVEVVRFSAIGDESMQGSWKWWSDESKWSKAMTVVVNWILYPRTSPGFTVS